MPLRSVHESIQTDQDWGQPISILNTNNTTNKIDSIVQILLLYEYTSFTIHTISIFSRKSQRSRVGISLTGIPLKLAETSASFKLFTMSDDPNILRRTAVSGADLLSVLGNEPRLMAFSF